MYEVQSGRKGAFFYLEYICVFIEPIGDNQKGQKTQYMMFFALLSTKNSGAGNGVRTRDPKLGKLVLYQLSYARLNELYDRQ